MIAITDDHRPDLLLQIPQTIPKGYLCILRGRACHQVKTRGNVSYANSVNLAIQSRAVGLHLSERQLRCRGKLNLRLMQKRFYVTAACHKQTTLKHGKHIDALLISPLFKTLSHPELPPANIYKLRCIVRKSEKPIYLMGGIKTCETAKIEKMFAFPMFYGIAGTAVVAHMSQRQGALGRCRRKHLSYG